MPLIDLPEVEKADWAQWKQSPVTKRAVAGLMNQREHVKEGLVEGLYDSESERLVAIGRAQALKDAVIYLIEDFDYQQKEDTTDVEGNSIQDTAQT